MCVEQTFPLFLAAPWPIAVTEGAGHRCVLVNAAFRRALGGRDPTGLTAAELFGDELGKLASRHLDDVYRTGEPFEGSELPCRDRFWNVSLSPWIDERCRILGVIGFGVDVTSQVRAREAARRAEHEAEVAAMRYRRLARANVAGIIACDLEGRIFEANDAFLAMVGFGKDDLARGTVRWDAITPPEWAAADLEAVRALRASGECQPFEKEYVRRDGTRVPVLVGIAVYETHGDDEWCVAVVTDLGRQKLIERDLRDRRERLEEAIRARDDFISIAAHELRTPLTTMLLQSEALARRYPTDKLVRPLGESVQRLGGLVEQLLDASRISSKGLELHLEDVDFCSILDEVVRRMGPPAERAGCPLTVHAHGLCRYGERDGARCHLPGRWDRARLDQALTNLLSNAIKFGRGNPIEIHCDGRETEVVVSVVDHGIGFDPADRAKMFSRFGRAVSERNYGGLGMGLWIAKSSVERMGGTLEAEGAPDAGATFTVRLPRMAPPVQPGG